jgi:manganese/zinc/iron transport system ATP- binding protein
MPPALEVKNLTTYYHKKPALWSVDLALPSGKIIGVIGPNGAGKSTLLKTVMGLVKPASGEIRVLGQPVSPKQRRRMGYMPQRGEVDWDFPVHVFDVVMMGRYGRLSLLQRPSKKDMESVWECLAKVKLTAFAHRQIGTLSGGQQQRTFLARAIAQDSDVYLMDEPFAGVDSTTETAMVSLFQELKVQGKTLVVVHHDLSTASRYFDELVLINTRLIGYGKTSEVFTADLLQKTYGGRLAILDSQHLAGNPEQ